MIEFEQLFRACWFGEAPWQALVDWVLEVPQPMPFLQAEVDYQDSSVANRRCMVRLGLSVPSGLPNSIQCSFKEPALGIEQFVQIDRGEFAAFFPLWIRNEIEVLNNHLRRNSYR